MMRHPVRVILCLFLFPLSVLAQTETATLSGRVTDPQGAVVPGAEVVATNTDTNVSNSTKTNEAGVFVFPSLPPGPFRLTVRSQGFATLVLEGLVLHVQDRIEQNLSLQVGSVDQRVTVTAESPLVNTESAGSESHVTRTVLLPQRSSKGMAAFYAEQESHTRVVRPCGNIGSNSVEAARTRIRTDR